VTNTLAYYNVELIAVVNFLYYCFGEEDTLTKKCKEYHFLTKKKSDEAEPNIFLFMFLLICSFGISLRQLISRAGIQQNVLQKP
jgi:hypothetical protein